MPEPDVPWEVIREFDMGGTHYRVYERIWFEHTTGTLRQVEFWPKIPPETDIIGRGWPFCIYLRLIQFEGWEQKKQVKRFTMEEVEGAENYGMVEYEGIGRLTRSIPKGRSDD